MSQYKIVTVADEKYMNMAKAMIHTAARYFPEASVWAELVNVSMKERDIIHDLQRNSRVDVHTIDFANQNQKKCYCTNRRGSLLQKIRSKCPDDILIWVDADMLFRKPCNEFKSIIEKHDFAAVRKPNGGMIRAALFSVGISEEANAFLKKYTEVMRHWDSWDQVTGNTLQQLQKPMNWAIWMANQRQLTNVFLKQHAMSFMDLDPKFCDVKLQEDSVIWNGISKNKSKDEWRREVEKYL